jgi:hypothetical protein
MGGMALDPAANIFGNAGSPNNMFTNQSSPESANDASYNMNNFYGQNIGQMMGSGGPMSFDMGMMGKSDGPVLSASTTTSGDGGQSAGEVFMGVQSPQPGGYTSWKWTMGSETQQQDNGQNQGVGKRDGST